VDRFARAGLPASIERVRGPAAAVLVLLAFAVLSGMGYGSTKAASGTYTYGYNYTYGTATLTVCKHVVNNNGGHAVAGDFTITITGITATGGNSFGGVEPPGCVTRETTVGSFDIHEAGKDAYTTNGYASSFASGCSGLIADGEIRTCTITNDDKPAHVVVIKHVIKDDGGTASAAAFSMSTHGTHATPADGFPGAESPGTKVTMDAGTFTVTESGPSGYATSLAGTCSGSIDIGDNVTCTVTNDDIPAQVTVVKHVTNNDKGTATAGDFSLTIGGVTVTGTNPFPGSEAGTTRKVTPGSYTVTEAAHAGYVPTYSAGCAGTAVLGQTKTCTVTNNDIGPPRSPGYWKTHLSAVTLGLSLGAYSVDTTAQAQAVFNAMNCSGSSAADAVGCLAGELLAAELNLANGNSTCINPTVAKATAFLSGGTVTVGGTTVTGVAYVGPTGSYSLSKSQRTVATTLASALDAYNNAKKTCTNP
jgi:hypothetical protein